MAKQLKVALPKGKLLPETASLLEKAGWGLDGYTDGARNYRLKSQRFPNLLVKMFHERDIPIQVAVGNYDLGICGLDWLEELMAKYSASPLVKLRNLGYGKGALYMVASGSKVAPSIEAIQAKREIIRLVSEYPNLAEAFALKNRLRRFSVFPLWGAAEGYPPESAELALVAGKPGEQNLKPVSDVLDFQACLIANKNSWEREDLSQLLSSLDVHLPAAQTPSLPASARKEPSSGSYPVPDVDGKVIRLALPDGHQQSPTCQLMSKAGIRIDDYPSTTGNRRPVSHLEGVSMKVIRPQDMPMQVANGNFDLAITGKDWLTDHLYQFPSSPATELLDLKFAWVRIVAVVSKELPVESIAELRQLYAERSLTVRVASEYTNISDKYARDNHLGVYKVIPTWGATEAFLPEDADLLIENTETGSTIARHNLKIIETIFESTGRLIGNKNSIDNPAKAKRIREITEILRKALAPPPLAKGD
ncbi:MAG: ATP phosphoribosyltransferase [Chloroflexi bacterium]|nr:ATP phosphoribosyltransferase [Chloroflexota bacterium]